MTALCQFAGFELVAPPFADPLVSARKTALADRPGGRKLLTTLGYRFEKCACCGVLKIRSPKRPAVPVVVAYAIDRMFRDGADGIGWLERWARDGIRFYTAGGVIADAGTADGWLTATIQVVMAAYEPKKIAERTSHGSRRHQSQGRRMSKQPPYGWEIDPHSAPHKNPPHLPSGLRPNLAEQAAIARIRELTGQPEYQHENGTPRLHEIARVLEIEGYPARKGGWKHTAVRRICGRMGLRSNGTITSI